MCIARTYVSNSVDCKPLMYDTTVRCDNVECALEPLEQFRVHKLFDITTPWGMDASFTNCALFMLLASVLTVVLMFCALRSRSSAKGGRAYVAVELIYNFVVGTLESNVGKDGLRYTPIVLTTFLFVLSCNLVGILPLGFTATSHVSVTFALSVLVCTVVTCIGFMHRKLEFLRIFLPHGTPMWLAPMMVFIKLFAYIARPVSLSIRLAANMIAGHTIIAVISEFVLQMHPVLSVLPFAFIIVLIGFEIFVAVLQAYIFTVLTAVYLSDSVSAH